MAYERIMGIDVVDDIQYQKYREAMMPLLHAAGGDFGYDFKIAEVMKSKSNDNINRVFTLDFPSEQAMVDFFASESYLAVKKQYFDRSVASRTVISLGEK